MNFSAFTDTVQSSIEAAPGSEMGLRPPSPLGTERARFPARRARRTNAPSGTRQAGLAIGRSVTLTVTVGREGARMTQPALVGVAIPVMPCERLRALDPLATGGTTPVLLAQELRAPWRRRLPRPWSVTGLEVRRPGGITGVGVALHRARALRGDGLPHAGELRPADRLGGPPGFPRRMGAGARGDPAPGWVRVAPSGPPREPSPAEVVACGERLATPPMPRIGGPPPQEGGEGREELGRGTPRGSLTEGVDLGEEGLSTGPARRARQLGRFVGGPLILASGLPEAVAARRAGGDAGLRRRQPDAPSGGRGGAPRPGRVV